MSDAHSAADLKRQSLACLLFLALILAAESFTNVDMAFQRLFYSAEEARWLITPELHARLRWVFYDGYKACLIAVGLVSLFSAARGARIGDRAAVRRGLLLFLSLALVPSVVSLLKSLTNIYTPAQLVQFGGTRAYQKVLSLACPENASAFRGAGFPAGHASGGFALEMLFFLYDDRRRAKKALVFALCVGWITGMYQVFRGEHFISHNFFTMVLAWQIDIFVCAVYDKCALRLEKTGAAGRKEFCPGSKPAKDSESFRTSADLGDEYPCGLCMRFFRRCLPR